jgi:hypothetical protein
MKKAPDLIVKNPFPVSYLNMSSYLLEECMSMKSHSDTIDHDLIDPGNPFINGMITKLSGTNSKEPSDSS